MSESSAKPRAVIDTNLFVSGTIFKRSSPDALLRAWRNQRFILLLSKAHYEELSDVFSRPEITVRYGLTKEELAELFRDFDAAERVAPIGTLPVAVRDANDEKIMAAALGGDADYLVTGDKDLLVLAGNPHLGKLKIVTAAEFLDILA